MAMGNAYAQVIVEQPERLMMQMQTYLAVAAAEADGDREFGEAVRAGWMRLWDTVHVPLGADVDETTTFMRTACSSTAWSPWGSHPSTGCGRGSTRRPGPWADWRSSREKRVRGCTGVRAVSWTQKLVSDY